MSWRENLKGRVLFDELLSDHTTLRIGGRAKVWVEPQDTQDLKDAILLAKANNLPIFVIGNGSNILIDDAGLDALVIRLNSKAFKKINLHESTIEAGGAATITDLLSFALECSLGGCEFLAGIPATIAGALVTNAGVFKNKGYYCIGDIVQEVTCLDFKGNTIELDRKDIQFGYRETNLKDMVVLSSRLKLSKQSKDKIKNTIGEFLEYRHLSQDHSYPNAGCIFRNPQGDSAGRLIDACGLKGTEINGAMVSSRHANFLVNKDKASAADFIKLMAYVQNKVKEKFAIELVPEIKIWKN